MRKLLRNAWTTLALGAFLLGGERLLAQPAVPPTLQELQQRLDQLEKQNRELKESVRQLQPPSGQSSVTSIVAEVLKQQAQAKADAETAAREKASQDGAVVGSLVPAAHHRHDGPSCSTGTCGQCSECLRIADVKTKKTPVYSCKVKEICIPTCNFFGCLFGSKSDCKKVEVRQLVKKNRIDEECVTRCATPEEAAKRAAQLQAKKVAEAPRAVPPATIAMPSVAPPRPFLESDVAAPPVSLGAIAPPSLTPISNQMLPAANPGRAN